MVNGVGVDVERITRADAHFASLVESGKLAGWQLAVTHHGKAAHHAAGGYRDRESQLPVTDDTLWRIYSMTKPIVSVTAMTLWEEGVFELSDPISKWIPSFGDARVYQRGSVNDVVTVPLGEPVRVWHLLTHTSGLTAGWMNTTVVDALYRQAGFAMGYAPAATLESICDELATLPLLFQPGSAWGYGMSTDVLGRLIEIWSGEPLDKAVAERVTGPLGMTDTVWYADHERAGRLAALYAPGEESGPVVRLEEIGALARTPPPVLSGAGGLLSTVADYVRFTRMLLGGGQLEGVRVVAPATLRLMTVSHLRGDLAELSVGGFTVAQLDGVGFGLGFGVVVDPLKSHSVANPGEYYWGGIASTVFWVDPVAELSVVFMTQLLPFAGGQLLPTNPDPLRRLLRQFVYSALVG